MGDSTNRTAINIIDIRIRELSQEDQTSKDYIARYDELTHLRESLLLLNKEDKEDVDMDYKTAEEGFDEDFCIETRNKMIEKTSLLECIVNLICFAPREHATAFQPDLLHNLPDKDPMLLLTEEDLNFIHQSVLKADDCSYRHRRAISNFYTEAKWWLERNVHVTTPLSDRLKNRLNNIISAIDNHVEQLKARAALQQSNTPVTDPIEESQSGEDSDEEREKISRILEMEKKQIFDYHYRQYSPDRKRFRESNEEQEERTLF